MIMLEACTKVSECAGSCWQLGVVGFFIGGWLGFTICAFVVGAHDCQGVRDDE